jgi:hypothetical protein
MAKWNEAKILSELKALIKQNGRFPTAKFLQNNNRWDLFRAIARHGGFTHFRRLLDSSITPRGYWKDNYHTEIQKIVDQLGRFPSSKEIRTESEGLFDFLFRTNLLGELREKYGYKPAIKPNGYWDDFDNLEDWLSQNFSEMISVGILPTTEMIVGIKGGRCIANDVIRKHGGALEVAKKMNCRPSKLHYISPDGHYLDSKLELIVDWYLWSRNITHTVHGFITPKKRYKYDFKLRDNLFIEVWGLSGRPEYDQKRKKKEELYKELGFTLISIEKELFHKALPKQEQELDKIFSKFDFDNSKIQELNLEDVVSKWKGYWTYENTLEELKTVVRSINNTFPTVSYLRKIGKVQIQKSMQKYGGQNVFRAELGMEPLKKGNKV